MFNTAVEVLLEFFAVIGVVFFLLLFYRHKDKIARSLQSCASLFKKDKADNSRDTPSASNDLEKGSSSEGQPSEGQPIRKRSSLHARVLAYLQTLPREGHDFIQTREIQTGESSVGDITEDYEGSEESLESNWIEIIYDFPAPPAETDVFKVVSEGEEASTSGSPDALNVPTICCTGECTSLKLSIELLPSASSANEHPKPQTK